MTKKQKAVIDIFNLFKKSVSLDSAKRAVSKKYGFQFLKNTELLKIYHKMVKNKTLPNNNRFEEFLITKPIRSLSGIINISVLTKPYPCPGRCIYCPREKGIPQSYLPEEPAVQRAILSGFNPGKQIKNRVESLRLAGHPIDKIELRIIGGTWSYYPDKYKIWFIKECFREINNSKANRSNLSSNKSALLEELKEEQKKNEKAKQKIIGITIETRPDYISKKEIKLMRVLGITRVELGVQSIYDDVLKANKRGHLVEKTIKATKLLRENGFKILYQMMPNLYGSNKQKDEKMFSELFSNQNFMPDLLKIYPLAVVKEAPMYKSLYLQKKYKPYSRKELVDLLIKIKLKVPYWCRIQRIIRDIPSKNIVSGGAKTSNLREIVQKKMKENNLFCKCIRCREVKEKENKRDSLSLFRENYAANGGKEIFLSFETKDRKKLYGILRLRLNKEKNDIFPLLSNAAIIREVHVYGKSVPTEKNIKKAQNRGIGKKLIRKAEQIARKENFSKIAIISGVGVRNYYRKLGYRLKETYMVKRLD